MISKKSSLNKNTFFSWDDHEFADFMNGILIRLEPRQFNPKEIIIQDNSLVFETFFIMKGGANILFKSSLRKFRKSLRLMKIIGASGETEFYDKITKIEAGKCIGHEMILNLNTVFTT